MTHMSMITCASFTKHGLMPCTCLVYGLMHSTGFFGTFCLRHYAYTRAIRWICPTYPALSMTGVLGCLMLMSYPCVRYCLYAVCLTPCDHTPYGHVHCSWTIGWSVHACCVNTGGCLFIGYCAEGDDGVQRMTSLSL